MSNQNNDNTMPAKESEKNAPTTATAVEEARAKADEVPSTTTLRQQCDGPYICDCSLCICGAPVQYPGDICYVCSKYH